MLKDKMLIYVRFVKCICNSSSLLPNRAMSSVNLMVLQYLPFIFILLMVVSDNSFISNPTTTWPIAETSHIPVWNLLKPLPVVHSDLWQVSGSCRALGLFFYYGNLPLYPWALWTLYSNSNIVKGFLDISEIYHDVSRRLLYNYWQAQYSFLCPSVSSKSKLILL